MDDAPYLSFCEVERHGDFVPPESGQVVVVGKLSLQVGYLALGESCALLAVPIWRECLEWFWCILPSKVCKLLGAGFQFRSLIHTISPPFVAFCMAFTVYTHRSMK